MNRPVTPVNKIGAGGARKVSGQAAAQAAAHGQDLLESNRFAPLRYNNKARCFTTGEDYFNAVGAAMMAAKSSIFIAGWQVNWDVEIFQGKRLIDILRNRVNSSPQFRVFVMPWLSPKIGLDTFDLETMLAVFQLNAGRASMQAMCCPAGAQSDHIGTEGAAFSHHQKLVVVDNKLAYIGGIDLAYGRRDDARFTLQHESRKFNELYNPGVPGSKVIKPGEGQCISTMDLLHTTLSAGIWTTGGNSAPATPTEPSAVSKLLAARMKEAKSLALDAVSLVNMGVTFQQDMHMAVFKAAKGGVNASAAQVVDAANKVSATCSSWKVPDLFGTVEQYHVGAKPTSQLPGKVLKAETDARKNYNDAVESAAQLSSYLSPLRHITVSETPSLPIAGALTSGETNLRAARNQVVDYASQGALNTQQALGTARGTCMQIGPNVEHGVKEAKAQVRGAIKAVDDSVNAFQRHIINEIALARKEINEKVLMLERLRDRAIVAADKAADNFIQNLSQEQLETVLKRMMRLAKMIYVSQLALSWKHVAAHPLLFDPKTKSSANGGSVLGASQPRQPWQDVHCEIEGPAVDDVARNFIGRWNAAQASYTVDAGLNDIAPLIASVFGSFGKPGKAINDKVQRSIDGSKMRAEILIPAHLVPKPRPAAPPAKPTGVSVRVLRSASRKLCMQEAQANGDKLTPIAVQHEIHTQMVHLIRNATDFVYIENQFFQTGFGKPSIEVFSQEAAKLTSGPMHTMEANRMNRLKSELSSAGFAKGKALLPANDIGVALGERIARAIRRDEPFHVYMVLPVHPEGKLDDITIVGQIHWTMQSLVFADHSLINLVRRAIAARAKCKNKFSTDEVWKQALQDAGKLVGKNAPYEKVTEEQWSKYLTLLNLRTCEEVGGYVRTEQVYIHSKLLIVDDRHIIMGSANINDRSQNGSRDSEIAVMLLDTEEEQKPLHNRTTHVNKLARKLRIDLWKKHFALKGGNSIVKPATSMEAFLEKPAAAATIQAVQGLASDNTDIYTEAFSHIPWSVTKGDIKAGASIWPVCPMDQTGATAASYAALMPFSKEFWNRKKVIPPKGIKGFITKLPIYWTMGENNHPGQMSVMALTFNELPQSDQLIASEENHRNRSSGQS